ncbi:DoxX family protein [Aeromicrobium sp. CTD01-1L150]|uniref:DoxX family protein n=1 Tax=Aeromicrobium sp. CTD01-1L150 TaxID=3341830 RepID=UPI0035C22359
MDLDLAQLVLRIVVGGVFVAHGWNHGFGPGGLDGTTRWFESIGLRPARLHAAISAYLEIGAGVAILAGLLVPVAAAAGIGVMVTAYATVHRANGFFIFRDGYEYVLVLTTALTTLAMLGAGSWSLDAVLDIDLSGWAVGIGALGAGILGSVGMLTFCWRPPLDDEDA